MLERLGYHAYVVANGTEAVAAIAHFPYAAMLMDCQMPDMDGYEATGAIRARERASAAGESERVPNIALTANALAADRDRCLKAGMADYLAKPLRPEVLALTLERWARVPEPPATQIAGSAPSITLLPSAR